MNKNTIDKFISDNNLLVSYTINYNNVTISKGQNKIYPIHSISKLFTNIMLILFYNNDVITNDNLLTPIKLDNDVLKKLSNTIKRRLKKVSILQCIKHEAGLKNYQNNYLNELIRCFNNKSKFPNPTEPEDFLIWNDVDILDKKEIGKYNYSNLGILLVALSLKYHYNKKYKTNLTYNQLLDLFIISKINLASFDIKYKSNYIVPIFNDDLTKYVNGSPATGYWLSTKDLCKFGKWINNLFNCNNKIKNFIKMNKLDIYWLGPQRLGHWGFLQTSSSCVETYLKQNLTIAILSNNNNDAHILMNKIKKILKSKNN